MAFKPFRRMTAEEESQCKPPRWMRTKKGRRCAIVCEGGRWRFVKREQCEGVREGGSEPTSEDVSEFTGGLPASALPLSGMEPMALMPVGDFDAPRRRKRRSHKGRS